MSSLTNLCGVLTYGQTPAEPSFRYKRRNTTPPVRYWTGHRKLLCELDSALNGGPATGQELTCHFRTSNAWGGRGGGRGLPR